MTTRLAFFDIDGTLVRPGTSGGFLAERLGHAEAMRAAEGAYARGEMDNAQVCTIDAVGYAGRSVEEVSAWLEEMPLIGGIERAVALCRARDYEPYIASLAWTFVGEHLVRRFGFAGCCGAVLEVHDGVFTGRTLAAIDEFGKRDFALERCRALGVDPEACLAVGDSRSDIPLFQAVGTSLALNASEAACAVATHTATGDDIAAAVEGLL